jgi:predicted protein tyrosine phosphatase
MDGIEVRSAGTSAEAECPVSADLLEWGRSSVCDGDHTTTISECSFCFCLKDKKIVCLDIPDIYRYMQSELVVTLRAKMLPLLRWSKI